MKADKNKDGRMNFKETRKLLKMMNLDMNEQHAMLLFKVTIQLFFFKAKLTYCYHRVCFGSLLNHFVIFVVTGSRQISDGHPGGN